MRFLLILAIAILALGTSRAAEPAINQNAAGRKLYEGKCAKCHKFYDPARYSDKQWQEWMVKMRSKTKLKPEQQEQLARYIETLRHPEKSPASGLAKGH